FPLAQASAMPERLQDQFMHPPVERRKLQPFIQAGVAFLRSGLQTGNKMFQDGCMAGAQAPSLCIHPTVEERAALDLQPLKKIADKQCRQLTQPLSTECIDTLLHGQAYVYDIHIAIA